MSKDKAESQAVKDYGSVIIDASFYKDSKKEVISVSPNMDAVLNGGIPKGTWLNVAGKEKTGKTSWVWSFIKNCQQTGMNIYYANIEQRLKLMNMNIQGIDLSTIKIVESTKGNLLTGDDHLNIANDILHKVENTLYIFDSVSGLCTQAETESNITNNSRPTGPKLLAQFCRKNSNVIPVMGSVVISIHHLAANVAGYGSPWKEDGGAKIQYQSDTKLVVKNVKPNFVENKDGKVTGIAIKWNIPWAANSAPVKECDNYIDFNKGFDISRELVDLGSQLGLIEKAGAWYEYNGQKVQGKDPLIEYFEENPNIRDSLYKEIRDLI